MLTKYIALPDNVFGPQPYDCKLFKQICFLYIFDSKSSETVTIIYFENVFEHILIN